MTQQTTIAPDDWGKELVQHPTDWGPQIVSFVLWVMVALLISRLPTTFGRK